MNLKHSDQPLNGSERHFGPRRFSFRQTTLNADQISSMAQTLFSTRPRVAKRHGRCDRRCRSDAGGPLRPCDPQASRREDDRTQRIHPELQLPGAGEEGHDDIRLASGLIFDCGVAVVDQGAGRRAR